MICAAFFATFFTTGIAFGETTYDYYLSRGKDTKFAYEVFLPDAVKGLIPVIIFMMAAAKR